MNKTELVKSAAKKADVTQDAAAAVINAFTDIVTEQLKAGEKVQLVGFGTFERRVRPARSGINPKTKEPMRIPETNVAAFKAGNLLKQAVRG